MTDTTVESRRCGALLGLAVGDALGTTNEFASAKTPGFGELITGPLTTMVGGGPFDLIAGQVTDDTQLACCLYASLRELGWFDPDDVSARYAGWSKYAFDVGALISGVLNLISSAMKETDLAAAVGADEIPLEWRHLVLDCEPKQKVWGTKGSYQPRVFECEMFD